MKSFHCDRIEFGLQIRSRNDGDRIFIEKMGGHKKISDYFSDQKLPRCDRNKIALLASGSDILWIMDEKSIVSDSYKHPGESACTIHIYLWEGQNDERNSNDINIELGNSK